MGPNESASGSSSPPSGLPRRWVLATAQFSAVLSLTLVVYRETLSSLVRVWSGSTAFAHGFLIAPICLVLAWRLRGTLAAMNPRPCLPAVMLLLPLGLLFLVGRVTGTLIVEQFSFVAMIPAMVWAFFGSRVTRVLAFPLGFLFFAVPFGEGLQPALMDLTADLAVFGLRLLGVPIARRGLFLSTPVGEWRVAEACSGLRFLMSGIALGCLFAYLMYQKPRKRFLFAALSIVVPLLANGIRATVLILVGYMTEMKLGRGFDHYAIGWIAFAAVMFVFFAVGAMARDPEPMAPAPPPAPTPTGPRRGGFQAASPAVAVLCAAAVSVWPALARSASEPTAGSRAQTVLPPEPRLGWSPTSDPYPAFRPAFHGAASETLRAYAKGGATVRCYIGFYEDQRQGRELIHKGNAVVDPDDPVWRNEGERSRTIRWSDERVRVRESSVSAPGTRLTVWEWYWLPDEFTTSGGWAKLLQARAKLLLRRDHAAVVVLSASARDDPDSNAHLRQFLEDMLPSIRSALHRADLGR